MYKIGFAYETFAVNAINSKLRNLGMTVCHVGKSGDQGIDFEGRWNVGKSTLGGGGVMEFALLGQCKKLGKSVGTPHVRDFVGMLHVQMHAGKQQFSTIQSSAAVAAPFGMLVSSSGFSSDALQYLMTVREIPLALVTIPYMQDIQDIQDMQDMQHAKEYLIKGFVLSPHARQFLPNLVVARSQNGVHLSLSQQ